MITHAKQHLADEGGEVRELTAEDMTAFRPLAEVLPALAAITKERITIRLSPEVVDYFRGAGEGWQSKLDEALKTYVKQQGEPLEETIRRVIREEVQSAMVKHAA